ncbi:hypothetical protein L3X38_017985 [Prunus dulcis]|uniref:Uncharacterized protein n=1 Tax=Prunus dulcis TaxID=3755 RepID=A0AAD4W964_PRUDU|nr:hypothetical protein L3X38_017985 [Prunus dulcis]
MLEKELNRSQEDWKYVPQLPYPSSLLQQPYPSSLLQQLYPKSYEAPSFVLFDRRKGTPKKHVNRFIDDLGPHDVSIRSWEDLASMFYKKYFQHEERVTTTQLKTPAKSMGKTLWTSCPDSGT